MPLKPSVLIIEDDTYIRDVYFDILTESGLKVEVAADGEEGLQKASQGGYSLILLDMMMPKLNGLGVLSSLKKTPPIKKNGPIILLTNLGHDPVVKEAIGLGVDGYLIKSDLNPEQLVAEVKKYLEKKAVPSP